MHLDVDPLTLCEDMSFGQRQMVELARALSLASRTGGTPIILLDEPTSVLEAGEIEILFGLVRELKSRASFVFVSHRLDELLSLSDRVYVMKDGKVVSEWLRERVGGELARTDGRPHDAQRVLPREFAEAVPRGSRAVGA